MDVSETKECSLVSSTADETSNQNQSATACTYDTMFLENCLKEHGHLIMEDFMHAMKEIVPTAKREGFAVVPEISFNDIGALTDIRSQLFEHVVLPIQQPELYNHFGLGDATAGILMYGPPG